ncbi:hypothetical protein K435DRAFT_867920 [Dendrothele bispora CBS 962.96]|uniref:Uncharacterized protein n=1 Tax=Dendrothele bispora (strain CBS 962.96) TaxID=1314807 RepID=A0A4S8LCX3_DENBC|nr:hypothetical protein K435DRAFT_867920 [Dendrothele bispora CBS 962.96]
METINSNENRHSDELVPRSPPVQTQRRRQTNQLDPFFGFICSSTSVPSDSPASSSSTEITSLSTSLFYVVSSNIEPAATLLEDALVLRYFTTQGESVLTAQTCRLCKIDNHPQRRLARLLSETESSSWNVMGTLRLGDMIFDALESLIPSRLPSTRVGVDQGKSK